MFCNKLSHYPSRIFCLINFTASKLSNFGTLKTQQKHQCGSVLDNASAKTFSKPFTWQMSKLYGCRKRHHLIRL